MLHVMRLGNAAASAMLASVLLAPNVNAAESASGALVDRNGKEIGKVALSPLAAGGVHLVVNTTGLPPGSHAFHLHETGQCEAERGFESAGDHLNPTDAEHGWNATDGPHAGDLPNVHVQEDGVLAVEYFVTTVSLETGEPSTIFDDDGSALVIHQRPDDYVSQPSGAAGDRIACAVIEAG